MRSTRIGLMGVVLLLGLLAPVAAQEETPQPPVDETAGEEKKKGFWERFPLYLELQVGQSSTDEIGTSLDTTDSLTAETFVELDEQENYRFAIGWTLPEEKGRFKLTYNAYREASYTLRAQGLELDPDLDPDNPLPWWNVSIADGTMTSQSQQPTFVDGNGNGQVDPGELTFVQTPFGTTKGVTANLDNQMVTFDLGYEREFPTGARRFSLIWEANLRYFAYEGNMPATAWIATSVPGTNNQYDSRYQGFTDGVLADIISLRTESQGIGPAGRATFLMKFFKQRLILTVGVNAAFIIQSSEVDSSQFFARLQNDTLQSLYQEPAQVTEERDKDVWHTGAEAGIRLDLIPGLSLLASYFTERYADAILLPTRITIPETIQQAGSGVTALYNTRDFNIDGWRAGIGFQF